MSSNRQLFRLPLTLAGLVLTTLPLVSGAETGSSTRQDEISLLREQIQSIQGQLLQMQERLEALEAAEAADRDEPDGLSVSELYTAVDQRLSRLENISEDWLDAIRFGGAVRLNYAWRDYDDTSRDRVGDFDLELIRFNADGSIGDITLSAEWRRYNDFHAIHHAWLGYEFNERWEARLGIHRVPFGILPFASHSFWFGGGYYLGFEDDYDSGLQLIHTPNDDWTFHYAFYKNAEYTSDHRAERYSFDLVTGGDQHNSEINQLNLRAERHFTPTPASAIDVGLSLQGGELYNDLTNDRGEQLALAAHMDARMGPWNLQFQGYRYEFSPANPPGIDDRFVQAGAFAFPFLMAAEADVLSLNVARSFTPPEDSLFSSLTCYNDFTLINPRVSHSDDSMQNVTGCSLGAGGAFIYFDWISGRNMWFSGGSGIGLDAPGSDEWQSRFNLNIGYYF